MIDFKMMKKEKNKLLLKSSTEEEFNKCRQVAKEALDLLQKELEKIGQTITKLDPQSRFFVTDGIIGGLLNYAQLPSYMLTAITFKYCIQTQLPYFINPDAISENKIPSYTG